MWGQGGGFLWCLCLEKAVFLAFFEISSRFCGSDKHVLLFLSSWGSLWKSAKSSYGQTSVYMAGICSTQTEGYIPGIYQVYIATPPRYISPTTWGRNQKNSLTTASCSQWWTFIGKGLIVAPTPRDPFLAQVPISSLWGCGAAQLVTGWPDPVANWVALCYRSLEKKYACLCDASGCMHVWRVAYQHILGKEFCCSGRAVSDHTITGWNILELW